MKRRFLITAMAVATALPMVAQERGRGNSGRLNFLTGYLSLTESQKAQAAAIFTAAETAAQTTSGQLTAARTALNTAIKTNPPDAELDRLGAAMGVIEGQMAATRAKASAKFYALLTAEQKTKYDELMSNGPGGGSGPGGRRRGGVDE